jgi:DNA polymerase
VERGHSSDFAAELASTFEWWADAGVDCLVQNGPRDWLKVVAPVAKPSLAPSEVEGRSDEVGAGVPRLGPQDQVYPERRREAASMGSGRADGVVQDLPLGPLPDQLPLFHEWLRESDTLPYTSPAAPRVCPSGDPAAGLMILTAMPSSEDCGTGTLVSGAAGRLFDRMLAAIGRSRETSYIAGLSCLRPAGGRLDGAGAERCAQIARHHIGLAGPKAVLLIGDACSKALLGLGAAQARGRVHKISAGGREYSAIVTLHPDYLLQQQAAKALAWADLQLLMEILD